MVQQDHFKPMTLKQNNTFKMPMILIRIILFCRWLRCLMSIGVPLNAYCQGFDNSLDTVFVSLITPYYYNKLSRTRQTFSGTFLLSKILIMLIGEKYLSKNDLDRDGGAHPLCIRHCFCIIPLKARNFKRIKLANKRTP